MLDSEVIWLMLRLAATRLGAARPLRRLDERGDVAEKIVIVGVFVALAVTVGVLVTHAVSGDATKISNQISGAP